VLGTFVASPAPPDAAELVAALRARADALPPGELASVSILSTPGAGDAVVCRTVGRSAEAALAFLRAAWTDARPTLLGRSAAAPRIWAT
jgi:hypothetical protein